MTNREIQSEQSAPYVRTAQHCEQVPQADVNAPSPVLWQASSVRVPPVFGSPAGVLKIQQLKGNRAVSQMLSVQHSVEAQGLREPSDEKIHSVATEGIRTPTTTLPFLDHIQASFGRHSLGHVKAHVGPEAAKASRAMNALAFASGDHVVFGGTPDLRTAAHEAAHIVQQQAGVQLAGGIGREGDAYERHADSVADAVVAGRSAEGLLTLDAKSPEAGKTDICAVDRADLGQISPAIQAACRSTIQRVKFSILHDIEELDTDDVVNAREKIRNFLEGQKVKKIEDVEIVKNKQQAQGDIFIVIKDDAENATKEMREFLAIVPLDRRALNSMQDNKDLLSAYSATRNLISVIEGRLEPQDERRGTLEEYKAKIIKMKSRYYNILFTIGDSGMTNSSRNSKISEALKEIGHLVSDFWRLQSMIKDTFKESRSFDAIGRAKDIENGDILSSTWLRGNLGGGELLWTLVDKVGIDALPTKKEKKSSNERPEPKLSQGRFKDAVDWTPEQKRAALEKIEEKLNAPKPFNFTLWKKPFKNRGDQVATMGVNAATYAMLSGEEWKEANWEWLHIQAASLGGPTDSSNLVLGVEDTNTHMMPFEANILSLVEIAKENGSGVNVRITPNKNNPHDPARHKVESITFTWDMPGSNFNGSVTFNPLQVDENISKNEVRSLQSLLSAERAGLNESLRVEEQGIRLDFGPRYLQNQGQDPLNIDYMQDEEQSFRLDPRGDFEFNDEVPYKGQDFMLGDISGFYAPSRSEEPSGRFYLREDFDFNDNIHDEEHIEIGLEGGLGFDYGQNKELYLNPGLESRKGQLRPREDELPEEEKENHPKLVKKTIEKNIDYRSEKLLTRTGKEQASNRQGMKALNRQQGSRKSKHP